MVISSIFKMQLEQDVAKRENQKAANGNFLQAPAVPCLPVPDAGEPHYKMERTSLLF